MYFRLMARHSLVDQGFLTVEASRSHPDTPQSVGLLWMSDQLDAETSICQNATFTKRDVRTLGGNQTQNPRRQATADPSVTSLGHWDRRKFSYVTQNTLRVHYAYQSLILGDK